jgi:hypothetical protein
MLAGIGRLGADLEISWSVAEREIVERRETKRKGGGMGHEF